MRQSHSGPDRDVALKILLHVFLLSMEIKHFSDTKR